MFVKNKEKVDFKYRKGSYLAVLKAMTVSYVDESKVSAQDLKNCYGQRIDIISRDLANEIAPHIIKEEEVKKEAPAKKVETVKKSDLNDSFIEQILGEIECEAKKDDKCEHEGECNGDCKCGCKKCTEEKAPEAPVEVVEDPSKAEEKAPKAEEKAPEAPKAEEKTPEAPKAEAKPKRTRTVRSKSAKAKAKKA